MAPANATGGGGSHVPTIGPRPQYFYLTKAGKTNLEDNPKNDSGDSELVIWSQDNLDRQHDRADKKRVVISTEGGMAVEVALEQEVLSKIESLKRSPAASTGSVKSIIVGMLYQQAVNNRQVEESSQFVTNERQEVVFLPHSKTRIASQSEDNTPIVETILTEKNQDKVVSTAGTPIAMLPKSHFHRNNRKGTL